MKFLVRCNQCKEPKSKGYLVKATPYSPGQPFSWPEAENREISNAFFCPDCYAEFMAPYLAETVYLDE